MEENVYNQINKLKEEEAKVFFEKFNFYLEVDKYVESLHTFLFDLKEKGKLNKAKWKKATTLIMKAQKFKRFK